MNFRRSLAVFSFLNTFLTALVIIGIVGYVFIKTSNEAYLSHIKNLEKTFIQKNKSLVQSEVHRSVRKIESHEKNVYEYLRVDLEEKVNFAKALLIKNSHTRSNLQKIVADTREELDFFQWDLQSGYFYIFDTHGRVLYHGGNNTMENNYIFDMTQNNHELNEFIKDTMIKDKSFGSYQWYKPGTEVDSLYKKYVYAKKIDELDIYIAAGIYKDELHQKIYREIIAELEKERFGVGDYGYFWIHSIDNTILMHPIETELVGQNLSNFQTLDKQYLFRNINKLIKDKKEGYISYRWYRTDNNTEDEKISYVHLIEELGIIVGSGFYLGELKDMLYNERKQLKDAKEKRLQTFFLLLSIITLASLILAWFIAKRIYKVETSQKEYFNMLEQYKFILDQSSLVSKSDPKGIITYVNESFCTKSGFTKEESIGHTHKFTKHSENKKNQFKELWQTIQSGKVWKGIIKNKTKDGKDYYHNATIAPIKDNKGNTLEYISASTDITELIENRNKLQSMLVTDTLTGLGNRVNLIKYITEHPDGSLAILNIDRFKEINDAYGHEIGDRVIREFAERLFSEFSLDSYTLYRVQGDIFAVYTTQESENELTQRIKEFINNHQIKSYTLDQDNFILSYTSGISSDYDNPLACADMALNEAKAKKQPIQRFDESINSLEIYKSNIHWVNKIYRALEKDTIVPYFQPIYNYKTEKVEKYECLMRLIDDNGTPITPNFYLPIAKKTKLYQELSQRMITKSLNTISKTNLEFSINLSVEDLMNTKLMLSLYEYAEKHHLFNQLVLEIIESEEIEDNHMISSTIKKFKLQGAKVAIDDFGSGYSNYDYLIKLNADYIKIDESIISNLLDDERTKEVLKSIVRFAKKSDMKTIAEFVSSKELDTLLRSLDVDYAQGYYYGKPQPKLLK